MPSPKNIKRRSRLDIVEAKVKWVMEIIKASLQHDQEIRAQQNNLIKVPSLKERGDKHLP